MRLPTNRTFLIRLSGDEEAGVDPLCGKVEHVQSGRSAPFTSLEELRAFVVRLVDAKDPEPTRSPDPGGPEEHQR